MSIGNSTAKVVEAFLSSGSEPEQGYKACAILTKLGDRYGHNRLENACSKVWELTSTPYHSFQVLHHTVFDHQGFLLGLNLCGLR